MTQSRKKRFVKDHVRFILGVDGIDVLDISEYMSVNSICGNTNWSKYQSFWMAMGLVLDSKSRSSAYSCRHVLEDEDNTNSISYMPGIVSMTQLCQETKNYLEEKEKFEYFGMSALSLQMNRDAD